ncbi:glycosyltransferase family 2 protein [uncultured Thiothrix sp.]|uniref:glycosyltransferase family 2 protein n=1 Tax=uncultured Thiothrix sp. TaxID=223185 RepID=UPI00261E893E|nr:glycosyltransferase family 2 protein [uncultured Thiothrix sp.]
MAQVQILLSTWNGEAWLAELLASLNRQSFADWELLVRDDGSQDQTNKIILEWQREYPYHLGKFIVDGEHLGSTQSFSRLVEQSTAPYLMFCDQDDIWFPEKIEFSLAALQALETELSIVKPIVVHTDLAVVNEQRALIASSFWDMHAFDQDQSKQAYLLTNVVSGCASIFNRAAADLAFPVPDQAIQHDRWLALVCAWFGRIYALPQPLLFYRQHGNNQIGADLQALPSSEITLRVNAWSRQAEAFLERHGDELSRADYRLVAALAGLQYLKGWERRRQIVQHRLFKQGILANLALLLFA